MIMIMITNGEVAKPAASVREPSPRFPNFPMPLPHPTPPPRGTIFDIVFRKSTLLRTRARHPGIRRTFWDRFRGHLEFLEAESRARARDCRELSQFSKGVCLRVRVDLPVLGSPARSYFIRDHTVLYDYHVVPVARGFVVRLSKGFARSHRRAPPPPLERARASRERARICVL